MTLSTFSDTLPTDDTTVAESTDAELLTTDVVNVQPSSPFVNVVENDRSSFSLTDIETSSSSDVTDHMSSSVAAVDFVSSSSVIGSVQSDISPSSGKTSALDTIQELPCNLIYNLNKAANQPDSFPPRTDLEIFKIL